MNSEEKPYHLRKPSSTAEIQNNMQKLLRLRFSTVLKICVLVTSVFALVVSSVMVSSDQAQDVAYPTGAPGRGGSPQKKQMAGRSSMRTKQHGAEEMMEMDESEGVTQYDSVPHVELKSRETMGGDVLEALENHERESTEPDVAGRMLVHSGHVALQAYRDDLMSLADKIEALVKEEGQGYVEQRSSNNNVHDRWYGGESRLSVDMQLRVSSKTFHSVVNSIRGMVNEDMILSISTNSNDVTDVYIDASSRADTLDASRKALKLLLAKADTVKEVMNVQRELDRLTQEYESQKSRALILKKQSVSCV